MGGHRSLRVPGRARGEDEVGHVSRGDRGGAPGSHVGRADARLSEEVLPVDRRLAAARTGTSRPARRCALGRPQDHHPLEIGQPAAVGHRLLEQLRIVGPEKALDGEEQPGPRSAQDVGSLRTPVPGVERHQQGPGGHGPECGLDPLGAVGCPDGHPVAPLDAVGHEAARRRPATFSASSSKVSRVTDPPGPVASTRASASPKRAAASSTRPGMVPHCRSPRGSITSDTASEGSARLRLSRARVGWPGHRCCSGVLAADRHHLAGHEGGVVAGQEHDDVGHLPHLGAPAPAPRVGRARPAARRS